MFLQRENYFIFFCDWLIKQKENDEEQLKMMKVKTGCKLERHEIKEGCYRKAKLTSCRSKQLVESYFQDILIRQKIILEK